MFDLVDLVVVGGGPAGTAAGITALQRGARVCLIEAGPMSAEKPGETLHPGVTPILAQLGILEAVEAQAAIRPEAQWIAWGRPSALVSYGSDSRGSWRAFQIKRRTLDELLVRRFVSLGGQLIRARVRAPVFDTARRVRGVTGDALLLHAKATIDASGSRSVLRRGLGVKLHRVSAPLVARYGYVHGKFGDAPRLVGDSHGWSWIAQVDRDLTAWVRLRLGRHKESVLPPDPIETWPSAEPRGAADVTWRMCESLAGPGWFLAGEAACTLDPASSHGVLRALMSGMMAADSAVAQLQGAPPKQIESAYSAWLQSWFQHDVARLSDLYDAIGFDWRPSPAALAIMPAARRSHREDCHR